MPEWSSRTVPRLVVLLVIAVTAACGGGGDDDEDVGAATSVGSGPSTSAATSAPSTTTTGAPRATTTSTTAPEPAGAPSTSAVAKTPRTTTTSSAAPALPDGGLTFFSLPSGNIGCSIDAASGVRCDILEADWELPPRPSSCPLDWIPGVVLGTEAQVGICAGDTAMGGDEVLAYDTSIRRGDYRCESARTGVTCRNSASGAGFRLSRGSVEVL